MWVAESISMNQYLCHSVHVMHRGGVWKLCSKSERAAVGNQLELLIVVVYNVMGQKIIRM